MNVYFDMDGVLADFNNAACAAHGLKDWWEEHPTCRGPSFWDLHDNLDLTLSEFWAPLEGHEFWASLVRLRDGFAMLNHVHMEHDAQIRCLTTPWVCAGSYSGKFEWFTKNCADLIKITATGGDPEKLPLGWAARLAIDPDSGLWAFNRKQRETRNWKR